MLSKVFVVYGHDDAARTELEAMLRRWKLEPLILDQLPSEGQTIIEKLEKYTAEVKFAVVLATPDDEGFRACHENEKMFRARQNCCTGTGHDAHTARSQERCHSHEATGQYGASF
ncbi:TIR domain-containing protein [Xylella fastidiosa]|uniref:TIR domain-containing protein n=1 Tax=Xylella fastidiosa TaxID=2371 RepID=UPI0000459690|nr:TIR domain-containing protein [Xylella fastidiosa]ERI61146.1 DNA-binding protein [Xylella fastidiosa subsp. multiplex Griffin-1]KFA41448.1 hypothetical protein DF22_002027 [Xylella fastidiosa]MDC6413117.1 nucleotide-binding protein [Xylella fastidiosa subsp. multiplex]MDC6418722.1 nucleotide-binding protein [Xylella fastidiosa subsp. multiplex]MDC7971161.1 nucleotide-binding protein [Xylella fastidiosa subsp. multiplex]